MLVWCLGLTRWARANVDDVTLRAGNVFVLYSQGNGLDENGILGPGFEVVDTDFRVSIIVPRKIDVHRVPAVGAATILTVELGDVLRRAGEGAQKHGPE